MSVSATGVSQISTCGSYNNSPSIQRGMQPQSVLAFKGSDSPKKDKTVQNVLLGALIGAGVIAAAAVIFKKPVAKFLDKNNKFVDIVKDLAKKENKIDTLSKDKIVEHLKEKHVNIEKLKDSFVMRLPEETKKNCGIDSKDAIAVGYYIKDSTSIQLTKIFKCDSISAELEKLFGNNSVFIMRKAS